MKRRSFNSLVAKGAIMSSIMPTDLISRELSKYRKKNPALKKGSRIGLVTPAGIINPDRIAKTKTNLDALGLSYYHTDNILLQNGYMAGTDTIRLQELHDMYADSSIDGIWCVRGGYGVTRLLDNLDFDLIKKNKKPLIGYSDITALLNTIHQKTGSPCFHGPVASSTLTEYTTQHLAPLFGLTDEHVIQLSKENILKGEEEEVFKSKTITSGIVTGELVGGNLSLLVSLLGTNHEVKTKIRLSL